MIRASEDHLSLIGEVDWLTSQSGGGGPIYAADTLTLLFLSERGSPMRERVFL
jgi:hypothetical protein